MILLSVTNKLNSGPTRPFLESLPDSNLLVSSICEGQFSSFEIYNTFGDRFNAEFTLGRSHGCKRALKIDIIMLTIIHF